MKGEALIRDASGGYLREVRSIVQGGGDVNWQMQGSGLTPLMAGASGGSAEVVRFLLEEGADPPFLKPAKLKKPSGRSQGGQSGHGSINAACFPRIGSTPSFGRRKSITC